MTKIAEIFSERIDRPIEEVIKVDALDDQIVIDEIREYYPTQSIQTQMLGVLEAYSDVRNGPTDKVGVWVSGFFGAGKSSFAKLLGILLESRKMGGQDAIDLFSKRVTSDKIKVLLKQIREHQPTHVVVFDILKDNIAGAAQHPVTLVMYRALLRSLGYPIDIDLAELEINIEESGELEAFKKKYKELYSGRTWDEGKRRTMTAFNEASATLHALNPRTYSAPDSWARTRARTDISPRKLAERALQLSKTRAHGRNVVFVVDEIGQYTARDLSRIGDLQGVIESFGQVGRGKVWLIATSQEKLEAILDIYDRDRTELARLQDRFGHKIFLSPSDIREVASHRVLAKKASVDPELRGLYQRHSGLLTHVTKVTGTIELPTLEEDAFVRLYPMLPYQVDLLINVVSGLRQQAGGAQTMGGANRTIIKLAQQLLIHPRVGLASEQLGRLVSFDSVYDLLSNNVATETQQELDDIERHVPHPFAGRVAKALVLLQFAGAIYATEENIAAVLHPAIDSPGVLTEVREAVEKLIDARKVRRTEHGLKIQSAAERTWDQERDSYRPTRGDQVRLIKDALREIWGQSAAQQPNHKLAGWKPFTAGLRVGSEVLVDGDVLFDIHLIEPDSSEGEAVEQARTATQREPNIVGWTLRISDDAMRAITERYRSERMQGRGARTREEEALLREEGRRFQRSNDALREDLSKELSRGRMFFQGNDRSPAEGASIPKAEAKRVLSEALEKIFHRFGDGSVQVARDDAEAILKTESLAGLPSCYSDLGLLRTEGNQVRLVTDQRAAKEVLDWIRLRCSEGRAPAGKDLEQHFGRPPYGWSFELIQLLVATLLRAGHVTLTSQSHQIKAALTPEARSVITNNTRFRALTVQIRETALDRNKLIAAARALETHFGLSCPSLTAESVASLLREKLGSEASRLESGRDVLRELGLPGQDLMAQALSVLRSIQGGDDEGGVLSFLESVDTLAKAIPRGRVIEERLTEQVRGELVRAITAVQSVGPVLEHEIEESSKSRQALSALRGHIERETFFDHIPEIGTATTEILEGFQQLYNTAFTQRKQAYERALEELRSASGWSKLTPEEQEQVAQPLNERASTPAESEPWRRASSVLPLVREETRAAPALLTEALAELRSITAPQAVAIHIRALLNGPISSPEELEAALTAIREAVEKALAEGRPVILV